MGHESGLRTVGGGPRAEGTSKLQEQPAGLTRVDGEAVRRASVFGRRPSAGVGCDGVRPRWMRQVSHDDNRNARRAVVNNGGGTVAVTVAVVVAFS